MCTRLRIKLQRPVMTSQIDLQSRQPTICWFEARVANFKRAHRGLGVACMRQWLQNEGSGTLRYHIVQILDRRSADGGAGGGKYLAPFGQYRVFIHIRWIFELRLV
jgi:hypothetical protein